MDKKVSIYLAGTITAKYYRQYSLEKYNKDPLNIIDPISSSLKILEELNITRDENNKVSKINDNVSSTIVNKDKDMMHKCDYVVAWLEKATFGTAMEIIYAFENRIPVYVINPNGCIKDDIWVRHHTDKFFVTIDSCFDYIIDNLGN